LKKQYKINDGKLFVVLFKSNHCVFFFFSIHMGKLFVVLKKIENLMLINQILLLQLIYNLLFNIRILQQLNRDKKIELILQVGPMSNRRERVPIKTLIFISTILIGVTMGITIYHGAK